MQSNPAASIIIPTYNYGHLIGDAIASVIHSDFPADEVEIIVVDDGSTDNTQEQVELYRDRVKYIFQENTGKAEATRVAIANTHGRYIFNLDADDFFLPNKLKQVVDCFESDPDLVHVAHPAMLWQVDTDTKTNEAIPSQILNQKKSGKELLSYFYRQRILFGGGSTFAARADVLKKLPIPQAIDMYMDEYLLLTTLNQGYSFLLPEPLSIWRIHSTNFSQNKSVNHQKLYRSLSSVEAVMKQINALDLDEEIKRLYELKTLSLRLSIKEQLNQKTWSDITHLLWCLINQSQFFGWDLIDIMQKHYLLRRVLPTPFINRFRQSTK